MQIDAATALSISTTSIRRHGIAICKDIGTKTKHLMANVVSASLMFDEASDIQMSKHLNMFVNVLLETGEVKTLTLALEGRLRFLVIVDVNFLICKIYYGIMLTICFIIYWNRLLIFLLLSV